MSAHFLFFLLFIFIKVVSWVCENLESPKSTRKFKKRYDHKRKKRFNFSKHDRLKKIAQRLKGSVQGRGSSTILFGRYGRTYIVTIDDRHGATSLRVSGNWPDPRFRLRLSPDDRSQKKFTNLDDIRVGHPKFDRRFIVQSSDEVLARKILKKNVCSKFSSHRKMAHRRIYTNIHQGMIEFGGIANSTINVAQTVAIIKNFVEIHGAMLANELAVLDAPTDFEMKFKQKKLSTCLVCGETVGDEKNDSVACLRCDTVHHPDCWDYIGKCSTYGCRSRKRRVI